MQSSTALTLEKEGPPSLAKASEGLPSHTHTLTHSHTNVPENRGTSVT